MPLARFRPSIAGGNPRVQALGRGEIGPELMDPMHAISRDRIFELPHFDMSCLFP